MCWLQTDVDLLEDGTFMNLVWNAGRFLSSCRVIVESVPYALESPA